MNDVLKRKNYDSLDLLKFILAIMIVAIHTKIFPKILYPWLRLAVPIFFMISAFLLFKKLNNSHIEDHNKIVKKYIIRQLKLYLFWFILLLPITVMYHKEWFNSGVVECIHIVFKSLLFSSTFIASWFIMASIYGTYIVYKLSQKINYKVLFIVFLFIYFICCIVSSYSSIFDNKIIDNICELYLFIFPSPVFSFPVSLIWIFIGKLFADGIIKLDRINKKLNIILILIFSILLFIEWKYVIHLNGTYSNDCYFLLIPVSFLIFYLFLNIDIKVKNNKILRKMSTIIYPLHASIAYVFLIVLPRFVNNQTLIGIITFVGTLIICLIVCFIIFKLENKKHFKFLKYSY